ncbi:MAG: HAMP domain-containing histidine kinase [Clostridia bacterium]|nr:HAMP domain-containing histidine kinase [Clostridia bacterium]
MSILKKRTHKAGSLYTRYIRIFFSAEIISLVVFGILMPFFLNTLWEDEQKQKLYDYTQNIAQVYQEYIHAQSADDANAFSMLCYAVGSASKASKADIFIANVSGNVIFCGHMAENNDMQNLSMTCQEHSGMQIPGEITTGIITDGMMATIGNPGGYFEEDCFIAACVSRQSYDSDADAIVFATQNYKTGLAPHRANFIRIYVLAAIGFIAITGLVVYLLTYNLVEVIRDMAEAAKRYSKGDFSYRIRMQDRRSVREFDELSAEINSMAESLEQLENSRANFVANVSHELKTPMTTIGGFIDGILDGTIRDEDRDYYLQIVSDEVKRLSRLVVSMLNMSKMEAGELKINPSEFDLTRQIVGIFIGFEQKINIKKINVEGLDSLSKVYIEADPDMINQVFYNLIDNAVKFTQPGGNILLSMYIQENNVIVHIRNTGKGIKDEDLDHVFERFYKGDKSRGLDAKSAGLGLFIVKNIVELHGGEISVSNVEDKYTQFTVSLKINFSDD